MKAQPDHRRTCIIGAGCAGLAAARALAAADLDIDVFEAKPDIGGNWSYGVYDATYLISSRNTSGFPEFPMPDGYPDFPSRLQMRDYLQAYVERFGLRRHIGFGQEVTSLRSVGDDVAPQWLVTTAARVERTYDSIVVANGHLWDKVIPACAGTFSGNQVHSRDYRNVADISGRQVLVVGAGNSGCDLVAEAAFAGLDVTLSMRRGHWFLPKTLFGVPRGELIIGKLPTWLQRPVLAWLSYVVLGHIERRGLPRPDQPLLTEPPIINSLLFYLLEHGRVRIAPEIERFDGNAVVFRNGQRENFDTILWATGYKTTFPFLEDGHLDWANGVPLRLGGGAVAPRAPGLYFNGLASPRGGNLPMHSACAELIAECVAAQRVAGGRKLLSELRKYGSPTPVMDGSVADIISDARRSQRAAFALRRSSVGSQPRGVTAQSKPNSIA